MVSCKSASSAKRFIFFPTAMAMSTYILALVPFFLQCIGFDPNTVTITECGGSAGNDFSALHNSRPPAERKESVLWAKPADQIYPDIHPMVNEYIRNAVIQLADSASFTDDAKVLPAFQIKHPVPPACSGAHSGLPAY